MHSKNSEINIITKRNKTFHHNSTIMSTSTIANGKRTMVIADDPTKTKKMKKTCTNTKVVLLSDIDVSKDIAFQPIVKNTKCNIIPIRHSTTDSTILVQISGGGKIPPFGVKDDENNPNKVSITLQIASDDDFNTMVKFRDNLINIMDTNWSNWHTSKKPSIEVIETLCNHFVHPKKPKKNNPGAFWDGLSNAAVNKSDMSSGKCRIIDIDSGNPVTIDDLPGRTWHKAVFELKHVYVLGTKSFGVTKILRYLSTSKQEDDDIIVPL